MFFSGHYRLQPCIAQTSSSSVTSLLFCGPALTDWQDATAWMESLDAETVTQLQPKTLRYAFAVPGDVVYIPFGTLVVEKATKQNNVFVRALSMLLQTPNLLSCSVLATAYYPFLEQMQNDDALKFSLFSWTLDS